MDEWATIPGLMMMSLMLFYPTHLTLQEEEKDETISSLPTTGQADTVLETSQVLVAVWGSGRVLQVMR